MLILLNHEHGMFLHLFVSSIISVCYWCIGMLLIFACWFFILRLCWSCLSVSGYFGLRRWGLLDIELCHLQIVTIWLPPFLVEYPLFFFLAWLLWLELQYCIFFFNCTLGSGVHMQIMEDCCIGIYTARWFAASIPLSPISGISLHVIPPQPPHPLLSLP